MEISTIFLNGVISTKALIIRLPLLNKKDYGMKLHQIKGILERKILIKKKRKSY